MSELMQEQNENGTVASTGTKPVCLRQCYYVYVSHKFSVLTEDPKFSVQILTEDPLAPETTISCRLLSGNSFSNPAGIVALKI